MSSLDQAISRWSRSALDAEPTAPRGDVARGLLRRLEAEEFLPDPARQDAAAMLEAEGSGRSVPVPRKFLADESPALARRVEALAEEFFMLDPPARQAAWNRLRADTAASPEFQARLGGLAPALTFAISETEELTKRQLALLSAIAELFVLSPTERALRLPETRERLAEQLHIGDVARSLQDRWGEWLKLLPELLRPAFAMSKETYFAAAAVRAAEIDALKRPTKPRPVAPPKKRPAPIRREHPSVMLQFANDFSEVLVSPWLWVAVAVCVVVFFLLPADWFPGQREVPSRARPPAVRPAPSSTPPTPTPPPVTEPEP